MRGAPGSEITLTIVRDDADALFDVTLKRGDPAAQRPWRGTGGSLWLMRVSASSSRAQEHTSAVRLKARGRCQWPVGRLILDLRNNPGGVLDGAVEVTDLFVNKA